MHNWFRSYLSGRMQFVKIRESRSTSRPLSCGIPQGSILGPMLYLGDIMREHGIFYHKYADDTQIYMSFSSSVPGDVEQCQARVGACVRDIDRWMLLNNLKLNNDKTELLVLHKSHVQPPIECVKVGEFFVVSSNSAKNIGVVSDSAMNLESHVNDVCNNPLYHIRKIAKIRRLLNFESKTPINAFVISRIDNCNALLYDLSS